MYSNNNPNITAYIPVIINNVISVPYSFNNLNNPYRVAPSNPIPANTDIIELVLCFTTSALFSNSNFGYFKLIIIPIKCDTNGISIDNIKIILHQRDHQL